jgi:hypothetical protein
VKLKQYAVAGTIGCGIQPQTIKNIIRIVISSNEEEAIKEYKKNIFQQNKDEFDYISNPVAIRVDHLAPVKTTPYTIEDLFNAGAQIVKFPSGDKYAIFYAPNFYTMKLINLKTTRYAEHRIDHLISIGAQWTDLKEKGWNDFEYVVVDDVD